MQLHLDEIATKVTRGKMAAIDELLAHYRELRAQMLDDIAHWRANGWRLRKNNEDITEKWLADQQARADKLGIIITAYE